MTSENRLAHLGFRAWPFRTIPSKQFSQHWLDMKQTYKQLKRVVRSLELSSESSIHPVWGWFGMGKTHALMHLWNLWNDDASLVVPVFHAFPNDPKSFLDLYASFVRSFLSEYSDLLHDIVNHILDSCNVDTFVKTICPQIPDFASAMRQFGYDKNLDVVKQWLRAERVHLSTLRGIGVSGRIDTEDKAVAAFAAIIRLVDEYPLKVKIAWLIDEFQLILRSSKARRIKIQDGILSVFNSSPSGLSILPAYSGRVPDKISKLFSGSLVSRIGTSPQISLIPLSLEDAKLFVKELLRLFRPEGYTGDEFFPFSEETVDFVLESVESENWYMKPRNIMGVLHRIALDYDQDIKEARIQLIERSSASVTIDEIRNSSQEVEALKRVE